MEEDRKPVTHRCSSGVLWAEETIVETPGDDRELGVFEALKRPHGIRAE